MEPIEFAGYALVILIFVLFATVWYAKNREAQDFNNGYCKHCHTELEHLDTDSQGGRRYECPSCGHTVWVSYQSVDNFKKN